MNNADSRMQYVVARECPECIRDPEKLSIHSYLCEDENGKAGDMKVFHSRQEASRFLEEVLGEDPDEMIIMPLSEADFTKGGHDHGFTKGEHDHGNIVDQRKVKMTLNEAINLVLEPAEYLIEEVKEGAIAKSPRFRMAVSYLREFVEN